MPPHSSMTDLTPLLATTEASVAVVGATDSPRKYGAIIYRDLKGLGYRVIGVNPNRTSVDGDRCFPNLAALPARPDVIDLVVPPVVGLGIAEEAVGLGYGNLWLQPGAESRELIEFLEDRGVAFTADSCIMVRARQVLRSVHKPPSVE